jgi:hypothetical protein
VPRLIIGQNREQLSSLKFVADLRQKKKAVQRAVASSEEKIT